VFDQRRLSLIRQQVIGLNTPAAVCTGPSALAFRRFVFYPNSVFSCLMQFSRWTGIKHLIGLPCALCWLCGTTKMFSELRNKHNQLDTLHFHYHFIEVQSLDMFRALLAHHQETLHECSFGDCCVQL
jgi:hypothetical protein